MNSSIKRLAVTVVKLLFLFSAPVSAADCSQKVLTSKIFNNDNSNGNASVNEVELCTTSVLMIESKIPITDIITDKSDSILISPVNNFIIIIDPVMEQELVVSFFSGNNKEFIALKIMDPALQSAEAETETSCSFNGDAVISPVLISDENIKSEELKAGDLVDVVLLSDQGRDKLWNRRIPKVIERSVKVFALSPSTQNLSKTGARGEEGQKLSWAFLNLSPKKASRIEKLSNAGRIILLQSENSDRYTAKALTDLSEIYENEKINDREYKESDGYYSDHKLKTELSNRNDGSNDTGVQTISIFRGAIEQRIKCNVTCSEYVE